MNSTSRNFLIVFVVLVAAASTVLFSKKADCSNSNYSLLVLVDFTDPIGSDAITSIKNHVWKTIEDMPDYLMHIQFNIKRREQIISLLKAIIDYLKEIYLIGAHIFEKLFSRT